MSDKGKRALPREAEVSLDFGALVATLGLLEGETVCLSQDFGDGRSSLQILGELALYSFGDRTGVAIGSSRLHLSPENEIEATLRTFDGNDFFRVWLTIGGTSFVIGDPDSLASSDFDEL
jgi:hypothetical protein